MHYQMLKVLCFLLFISSAFGQINPNLQNSLNSTGLNIVVAGDLLYDQGLNPGSEAENKLVMRGAEVGMYAPIDQNFNGNLNFAAHDEDGETVFELHELTFATSRLIPRTNIKVGQYFLGVGRLNHFHQHDWPFIQAPKVHKTFFADEGVFDAGIETSHIIPWQNPVTFTLGLTSGRRWGHAHSDGPVPQVPTHYGRLSLFTPFSTQSGLDLGISYLGRTDATKNQYRLYGLDITYKDRIARRTRFLSQNEFWFQQLTNSLGELTEQGGMYLFNQYAFHQQWAIGARLDMYKDFSITNSLSGKKLNNIHYGGTIQSSFISSEFARITAALSHEFYREEGLTLSRDTRFQLQLVFILGSHPAHDF